MTRLCASKGQSGHEQEHTVRLYANEMSAVDTEKFSEAVAELCQNQVRDAAFLVHWQLDLIGKNT